MGWDPITPFFSTLNSGLAIIRDSWHYLTTLQFSGVLLYLLQGVVFALVVVCFILIPGFVIWRRLTTERLTLSALIPSMLIGTVFFLITTYFLYLVAFSGWRYGLVLGLILVAIIRYDRASLTQLRELVRGRAKRIILFVIACLLLAGVWVWPSVFTGFTTTRDTVLFTPSMSGERLLFTGYAKELSQGIPASHGYWQDLSLSYHYFGLLIFSGFAQFGLDPFLTNFGWASWFCGGLTAAALWWIAASFKNGRRFAWAAPVIFFLWDNLNWAVPSALRYAKWGGDWHRAVFHPQHHIFQNGQANIIAMVIFLAWVVVLIQILRQRAHLTRATVVLAVILATLILVKVQVMVVLWGVSALLFLYVLVRKTWFSRWRAWLYIAVAGSLSAAIFMQHAAIFIESAKYDNGITFRPFTQIVELGYYSSFARRSLIELLGRDHDKWNDWWMIAGPYALPLLIGLTFGCILFLLSFKGLGLLSLVNSKKSDATDRRVIHVFVLFAVVALSGQYLLSMALGNQWQFVYYAYPLLAVLTAYVLYQTRHLVKWMAVLTLLSVPSTIGYLQSGNSERYVELPTAEISVMKQLAQVSRLGESCLFVPPAEKEDRWEKNEIDLRTGVRGLTYPVYANCTPEVTLGYPAQLNLTPKQRGTAYHHRRDLYEKITTPDQFTFYLSRHAPKYVWIAAQPRWNITQDVMQSAGYEQIINDENGGTVYQFSDTTL